MTRRLWFTVGEWDDSSHFMQCFPVQEAETPDIKSRAADFIGLFEGHGAELYAIALIRKDENVPHVIGVEEFMEIVPLDEVKRRKAESPKARRRRRRSKARKS
jgi:hypothetical protein